MNRFVLPAVFVCLVIANNVSWGLSGIEGDSVINDVINKAKRLENQNQNLSSIFSNPSDNNFPAGALPAINEGQRLLKEKCLNISKSNDSYNTIMEAKDSLETCMSSLFNITEIKKKIEVAKPVGDVDVVFKEYCKKSPNLKACMLNYTTTLDVCLEEGEKESKTIVQNVTEALLSFVCHDEGDRIAFAADGENIVTNGANIVANGAKIVANGVSGAADEVRDQILDVIDKNVRSFMTSNSVQAFFKRKCAKNPEVDSYEKTQEATDDLMNCVSTVFDSTSLSDLDFTRGKDRAIFERYCTRSSEIMHCVRDFASILSVCFDKGEKDTDNNTSSIISKIMYVWLLYSCHGNKLMSFLKMGGSKCVESKRDSLHRCGEPIDNYLKVHGKLSSRFPSFMFEKAQCGMISNTRQCVVDELSKCDRPTAAVNYYSSLFDVFRDMSPCSVNKAALNVNNNNNNYNKNIDPNSNENKNIILTIFSSILLMIRSFDYTGSIRQIIPRAIPCLL